MNLSNTLNKVGVVALLLATLTACQKDVLLDPDQGKESSLSGGRIGYDEKDVTFFALDDGTRIDKLTTKNPGVVSKSVSLSGLQVGEKIMAMDFRPATGQLYGLGSTSRLYIINPETGISRAVSMTAITPALSGTIAGFDFNPTVDRIRVVTSQGQNLRLNPETATVQSVDGPINPMGAMIAAAAYTNNVAGATTTTLYDIDLATRKLYRQDPPNAGTLVEVGSLKLNITGEGGFDIAPEAASGLALFEVDKKSTLFTVDLTTGATKIVAKYGKKYTALAIPTRPVAYAVTAANSLLIFDPSSLTVAGVYGSIVSKPLGLTMGGETVVGIDFRPLNGQLYALTSASRIFTVNTASGGVTLVGTLSTPLAGTEFGFDFNPLVDLIRIVSNTGQNLRYNPNDATAPVFVDGPLNPATTGVSAAAYTNNFAGTTSTMLFDIDANTDRLYVQSPPNTGKLTTVGGTLGVNIDAANGFDIGGTSNVAYALLTSGMMTKLYTINLTTGAAKPVGSFSSTVKGFAIGLGF